MLYGKGRCIGPFNFQENNLGVCSLGLQIEGGCFFKVYFENTPVDQ